MPKIPLKFSDYLKTGSLGEVRIGSSRAEVIQYLGPPGLWDGGEELVEDAYKFEYYGILVMFEKGDAVSAMNISATEDWENSPIKWTDPFVGERPPVEKVEEYLIQHSIGYRVLETRGKLGYQFVTEGNVGIFATFHVEVTELEDRCFHFDRDTDLTILTFVARPLGHEDWSY